MLFNIKFRKYLLSIFVCFLIPTITMAANYKPLPDDVPAYDETSKIKEVKKKVVIKRKSRIESSYTEQKIVEPFTQDIQLFVGETRVVKEPNAGRLAVGNGKVLSAAVLDDREILLIANDVGVSSLHVWTKSGKNRRVRITVVPGETRRVASEIVTFLKTIPNAKASVVGDKVVVEGDNMTDADLAKIQELAKRYPQIINFTNRMGWEKMIAMDVRVVEFPSTYLREVGIKWGATGGANVGGLVNLGKRQHSPDGAYTLANPIGAPIIADSNVTNAPSSLHLLSVLNVGFNAQLNLLEQDGTAVVLARPTLSTRSGTKANFLAGGEIPYTVSNINGTTVQFKQYGIKLEIEPMVDKNGVIRAKIMSEVSDIDPALSVPAGPALRTRKTESEFNVQDGETIVLSGLLSKNKNTTVDKLPFLGDIPILGALFRSKRYQNNETELVVFVTPKTSDKHTEDQQQQMEQSIERLDTSGRLKLLPAAKETSKTSDATQLLSGSATN